MPAAIAILGFVGKEVGKKAFAALIEEYFPNEHSFERETAKILDQMNHKLDKIDQDVSYSRIQPVRDRFTKAFHYFNKELVPFLTIAAKTPPSEQMLTQYAKEVRQKRLDLGSTFDQGMDVYQERLKRCDFPVRMLFETLQAIAALKLVYLSWEYALYQQVGGPDLAINLQLIDQDYKHFKTTASKAIKHGIEALCKARLDFISFSGSATKALDGWPNHVMYDYHDRFSSSYDSDPFRGAEIHYAKDIESKIYDIWLWGDKRRHDLGVAYDNLQKYTKEHQTHVEDVKRLNKEHIEHPTKAFLEQVDSLPSILPAPTPMLVA